MQTADGVSVADNTKNNNNVAWKNLRILPKPPIAQGEVLFGGVVSFHSQGTQTGIRFTAKSDDGKPIDLFDSYSIVLKFDEKTRRAIRRNSKRDLGTRVARNGTVVVHSQMGMVTFNSVRSGYRDHVEVSFISKSRRQMAGVPARARVEMDHFQNGRFEGGYAFQFE